MSVQTITTGKRPRSARSRAFAHLDPVPPSFVRAARWRTRIGSGRPRSSGFNLVELIIVVAIMLVVAAFAIPTMVSAIDAYQIRGNLASAANMAQRCRMQALRNNTSQRLFFTTQSSGQVVLFVENSTSTATTPVSSDPQLWLPKNFALAGASPSGSGAPSAMTANTMWGSNISMNLVNQGTDVYFNSRGIPCSPGANSVCGDTNGFVYYFNYTGTAGRLAWAAVSISPAGRIQSWFWNGASWAN